MNVAILADAGNADGTLGGAELTMREFALAAPDHVTLTDDPTGADVVVIGNCVTLHPDITRDLIDKRVIRYHNDLARHEHRVLREWLEDHATHVFTSPLHQRLYGLKGDHQNVPPPVDRDAFTPPDGCERGGAVAIAPWQNPGKGQQILREWSDTHEPVDVYGAGAYTPHGPNLRQCGPLAPEDVPAVLWQYERFVFLPTAPEPFGRTVIEAHYAGCDLVVNRQVGALHYLEREPEKLATAAEDFWDLVCEQVPA
jgi:hypothetical protein